MYNNDKKIKVVFMGTPDFACPTLERLYNDKDIDVSLVITKEDKLFGRGKNLHESDVKVLAKNLLNDNESNSLNNHVQKFEILTPKKIKEDRDVIEKIKNANPDFIVVVAYGQILSKEILNIPKMGCINGHASLLPLYRGSSPIQGAILRGDKVTGTTSMLMGEALDEGDILLTKRFDIEDNDNVDTLFEKLSVLTADCIIDTIKTFDSIKPIKQDNTKATYVKIIKKEDGLIEPKIETKEMFKRKLKAYFSWPGVYIKDKDKNVKIFNVDDVNIDVEMNLTGVTSENNRYGLIIYDKKLYIGLSDGFLEVLELQLEGRNRITQKDYINGNKSHE